MYKTLLILSITFLPCVFSSLTFAEETMRPGRWEITSSVEMPGMAFTMPSTKHVQCLTDKDLIPESQQQDNQCEILENTQSGNTVTWKVVCNAEGGTMTSSGKIVYNGDTFEGTVVTNGPQMPSGMTQTMTGKRIGECQ